MQVREMRWVSMEIMMVCIPRHEMRNEFADLSRFERECGYFVWEESGEVGGTEEEV